MADWTEWKIFPDPRKLEYLCAPIGPGVYEVRNHATKEPILFGSGGHCAYRMTSLLPSPFGAGTRNNAEKRSYMLDNLGALDYRCRAFPTKTEAEDFELLLKKEKPFRFPT